MSRKRKKLDNAELEKVRLAAAEDYKSKVDDMLKGFNQQAFDWQDGEESRDVRECRHLIASRRDPNHDFYGHLIKFHFPTRNESVFVRTCRTCIDHDLSLLEFAVACVHYNVLSEVTMRREIVNTMKDGLRMEATSERSKKLMDEVFQADKVN
jgi:hypothetical protein